MNISDQLLLSHIVPLEPRESNLVITNDFIKVESLLHYFERIDQNSRYLGLEVVIIQPAGNYQINTFLSLIDSGSLTSTRYRFNKLDEASFLPIPVGESDIVIINDLITGGVDYALSAEQGVTLKALLDAHTSGE